MTREKLSNLLMFPLIAFAIIVILFIVIGILTSIIVNGGIIGIIFSICMILFIIGAGISEY